MSLLTGFTKGLTESLKKTGETVAKNAAKSATKAASNPALKKQLFENVSKIGTKASAQAANLVTKASAQAKTLKDQLLNMKGQLQKESKDFVKNQIKELKTRGEQLTKEKKEEFKKRAKEEIKKKFEEFKKKGKEDIKKKIKEEIDKKIKGTSNDDGNDDGNEEKSPSDADVDAELDEINMDDDLDDEEEEEDDEEEDDEEEDDEDDDDSDAEKKPKKKNKMDEKKLEEGESEEKENEEGDDTKDNSILGNVKQVAKFVLDTALLPKAYFSPYITLFGFKSKIRKIFKKVRENACKITSTEEFYNIIRDSIIETIKNNLNDIDLEADDNENVEEEEETEIKFTETLYSVLLLMLMEYDNKDAHLFIINQYNFLMGEINKLQAIITTNDNAEMVEKTRKQINRKELLLKSFVERVIISNELFLEYLVKNPNFLKKMGENPDFLRKIVEKTNYYGKGNEFTEQLVKYSKNIEKNKVDNFLRTLINLANKNGIEIDNGVMETMDEEYWGGEYQSPEESKFFEAKKEAEEKDKNTKGTEKDKNTEGTEKDKKAANKNAKPAEKKDKKEDDEKAADEKEDDEKAADEKEDDEKAADEKEEETEAKKAAEITAEKGDEKGDEKAEPKEPQRPEDDGSEIKTNPLDHSEYFNLNKIKYEIQKVFFKITEKIGDHMSKREFHESLQTAANNEIETIIINQVKENSKNTENIKFITDTNNNGFIQNSFFYQLYHILFQLIKDAPDAYLYLENHCRDIIINIKKNEKIPIHKNLIIQQKQWINMFIEKVILHEDNTYFMDYLLKDDQFCHTLFHHRLFHEYTMEAAYLPNLVKFWTTYVPSEKQREVNSKEEEEEDAQAIKEEGVEQSVRKQENDTELLAESHKKVKLFIFNLNSQMSRNYGGGKQVCPDTVLNILGIIPKKNQMNKRLSNNLKIAIGQSNIGKMYQKIIFNQIGTLITEDIEQMYKQTTGKNFEKIYEETEYYKLNKKNQEDFDNDTFIYSMTKKENQYKLIQYITSVPENKGYEILIDYILTNKKMENNRLFLFRNLFEMMTPTDMEYFLSDIDIKCSITGGSGGIKKKKGGAADNATDNGNDTGADPPSIIDNNNPPSTTPNKPTSTTTPDKDKNEEIDEETNEETVEETDPDADNGIEQAQEEKKEEEREAQEEAQEKINSSKKALKKLRKSEKKSKKKVENKPCSVTMYKFLDRIQNDEASPSPINGKILAQIVDNTISEKVMESLFQINVINKINIHKPDSENMVKRFLVLLLNPNASTVSKPNEIEITNKKVMIEEMLSRLSNYRIRKIILLIFNQLSKSPIMVNTIANPTSLYSERMKQFYTGYISDNDDKEKMKKKIMEILTAIKNGDGGVDKINIVNNKCNKTLKTDMGGKGKRKTYRKKFGRYRL